MYAALSNENCVRSGIWVMNDVGESGNDFQMYIWD